MLDSIKNELTLIVAVNIINQSKVSPCFGAIDINSSDKLAGRCASYLWINDCFTSDLDLEDYLDKIYDAGANFDPDKALEHAKKSLFVL